MKTIYAIKTSNGEDYVCDDNELYQLVSSLECKGKTVSEITRIGGSKVKKVINDD